jgi:uncharacterized protein YndB with AHSA1/START domain
MAVVTTDRIEKKLLLSAPRSRIWAALTNAEEFGRWFGVKLEGPFKPSTTVRGTVVPTTVDAEVASAQQPYAGMAFDIMVDRIEPERLFSFRWHPGAEPEGDSSHEPTTLVVFTLDEAPDGIMLTVTESGFDQIPLSRRAKAFSENEAGWTMQLKLIEKYLAQNA